MRNNERTYDTSQYLQNIEELFSVISESQPSVDVVVVVDVRRVSDVQRQPDHCCRDPEVKVLRSPCHTQIGRGLD